MGNFALADNARLQNDHLQALLKRARLTLIDTGTRNRLIHCPAGSGRGKAIEINDEISDCVLESLLRNGRRMSFIAGKAEETEAKGLASDDQSDDKPSARCALGLTCPGVQTAELAKQELVQSSKLSSARKHCNESC